MSTISSEEKRIFSFWEPKGNIPGYIRLCMKTWEKFLPDYKVALCDYETLKKYLSAEELSAVECRLLSLPQQSDALRCALLYKYGGMWMDTDTIITPAFSNDYFCRGECSSIGNKETGFLNGAYFYVSKGGTPFVSEWYTHLLQHMSEYRKFIKWRPFFHIFSRPRWRIVRQWDFFLNSIIDRLAEKYQEPEFVFLERKEIRTLPELLYCPGSPMDDHPSYIRFWFSEENTQEKWDELERNKGIIMLHNSWTPEKYKQMSEEEFLSENVFLSVYLKSLLGL